MLPKNFENVARQAYIERDDVIFEHFLQTALAMQGIIQQAHRILDLMKIPRHESNEQGKQELPLVDRMLILAKAQED